MVPQRVSAQVSYYPSTNDLWDISQGTIITANSPLYPGEDARNMFGGTFGSPEPSDVLFADGEPAGFTHYVEWKTAAPVTVGSFALFAVDDNAAQAYERGFTNFVLKAKSSAAAPTFDLTLFSMNETNHPFILLDPVNFALIVTNISPVTAQYFRAEFGQYTAGRGLDGPRVIELDGFVPTTKPPVVLVQPTNQTVFVGDTATFSVLAQGGAPLSYQWHLGTNSVPAATNSTLTLTNVQLTNVGNYSVFISNAYGSTNSSNATLTVTIPACDPPPTNLVAWFAGESNALDNVGGNIGSPIGNLGYAPGRVGKAFSLDGSTAAVSFPASANLNVGISSGLTIECWIKPNTPSVREALVEWNTGAASGTTWGVHFWISESFGGGGPGCLYGNIIDSGANHTVSSATGLLQTSVFQHIALTYDKASGNAVLYLNGTAVGTQNLGALNPQTSYNLYLGERPSEGAPSRFNGVMDEVGIYNRALSGAEIQAIYAAQSVGKCPVPPQVTVQPQSQTQPAGATFTFTPLVSGSQPISYQWQLNGANLPGATNVTLSLTNLQLTNAGTYVLAATNAANFALSSNAVLTVTNPICVSAPSNLIGWWAAEGNAIDNTGTNGGFATNGVTYVPGKVGLAFSFNGTSTIQVPNNASLNFGPTSPMTIELWAFQTVASHGANLVGKRGANCSSSFNYLMVFDSSQGLQFHGQNGAVVTGGVLTGIPMPTNVWIHLAATFDGTTFRFYTNGILCGTGSGTLGPTNTAPLSIGNSGGCGDDPGLLDEVSIYNRALSQAEIQAIYYAQFDGKCPPPPAIFAQPQSQTVTATSNVTFTAGISGSQPVSYQWRSNSIPLAGATNASLTLSNVQPSFVANYSLAATNALNYSVSSNATLKVTTAFVYGNGQLLTNSQYNFAGSETIAITNVYSGGLVFYTLDGSAPSFASTLYSSPFVATQSCTLRVLAYSTDFSQAGQSDPLTLNFPPAYTLSAATPRGGAIALSPPGGTYLSYTFVGISATASNGWGFLQWTGDAGGTNRTQQRVDEREPGCTGALSHRLNHHGQRRRLGDEQSVRVDIPVPGRTSSSRRCRRRATILRSGTARPGAAVSARWIL